MNAEAMTAMSDDQLWQRSGEGDREAFARIVERYQSLICSLAYSACGNLAGSEDLAQETFIAAWQKLGELREPARLRAWLCGIVRNLAANAIRRDQRRGVVVQSLDSVAEPSGSDADPAVQAISQEEADLLWRALAGLSETYREPMVLFYRQGQSVAEVARSLDLAEDAVKQRLSRGRSMLREELASIVKTTLTRTCPTRAFTVAVLAALPAFKPSSAAAASLATAATGKAAAKGVLAGMVPWAIIGPPIGLLLGLFSARAAASTGRSAQERACMHRHVRRMILFSFAMSVGLALALSHAVDGFSASPGWIVFGLLAWVIVHAATITWISSRMRREVVRIRAETGTNDAAYGTAPVEGGRRLSGPLVYESKLRFLGLPVIAVGFGGADPGSIAPRKAVGWVAAGDIAISPFLAVGCYAIAPLAIGMFTIGILSLSLWGVGVGVVACGSAAVGWWAYGLGAIGYEAAAGGAVLAKDYAVGFIARAAEANTPVAKAWFTSQWHLPLVEIFVYAVHFLIVVLFVMLLGRILYRSLNGKHRGPQS
jgi:RNA polymerase sigma factor (sigma-70 family)